MQVHDSRFCVKGRHRIEKYGREALADIIQSLRCSLEVNQAVKA